jgi:hypothetical protein
MGRPSIPPEKLLRAMLLQAFYSIRSQRQLMERLELDLFSKEPRSAAGRRLCRQAVEGSSGAAADQAAARERAPTAGAARASKR